MEGPESSINRIGRTIWTVWGYLSGAVGRYLKPEVSNEDKQNGEDTGADVTVSKSYRELKENEEEKERSETNTWAQSESPQSGVRVRIAAVQWEKANIRKDDKSRHTGTGVAWNTGVQEGHKVGIDRKAQEKRDGDASDNNNEAVRTKSNVFVEEAFVDAPSSIDVGKRAQDLENSGSVETRIDAERNEHVTSDNAENAAMKNESAGQGLVFEELTNKCGSEHKEHNVTEALDKKIIEHTKDQDENEKQEEEQRTNQRMAEYEDEAYTSGIADDLLSQLTYSTKQMEDLFCTPLSKELKVDGKHRETIETTESKSEREVIEANIQETKQSTEGTIKHEQDESMHGVVDYESNLEEAKIKVKKGGTATACELLEEPRLTPGKEDTNDETIQEIVATIKDGHPEPTKAIKVTVGTVKEEQHEAGLESSEVKSLEIVDKLDIHESQTVFTEEMVKPECESLEEPATRQMENVEIYGNEPESFSKGTEHYPNMFIANVIEESINQSRGTTKDEEQEAKQFSESKFADVADLCESKTDESPVPFTEEREKTECDLLEVEEPLTAGLESSEFIGSEIADNPDIHKSKLDENQTVFTEEMAETECEPLEEPATGQMENAEIYGKEPEPISESTENETTPTTEMEPVNIITSNLCESKLDESPVQFTEERVKTECDISVEPVTGHMEVVEVHEKDLEPSSKGTENDTAPRLERESTRVLEELEEVIEFTGSEIAHKSDIHQLMLDENQIVFTEEMAKTGCEPVEGPVTGQMENAEIYGKEAEPISESSKNKTTPTTEMEPVTVIKQSDQVTLGTTEGEQQEAKQLSESKCDEAVDLCESKLDESPVQFTEERVKIECDLFAEVHVKDLEPSSKGTENAAALLPDSETLSVFLLAPTEETVVTGKREQSEADQEQLLGEFIGSEITEKLDIHGSKLHETQSEFTEGIVEHESSSQVSLMKMTFNDESVDRGTAEAVVKEVDQLDQPEENSEAGTTSQTEEALKTEEERLGDTIHAIYGSQIPEVVIKQDSELVITLVAEEPGNQNETTEFQQEVRAEVAADVVKKSAEMDRVHEQHKSTEHLALQDTMALSILEHEPLQELSADKNVIELQLPEEQISNMQRDTREMDFGSDEEAEETAVESVDKIPSSSPQELDQSNDSIAVGVELLTGLTPETKASCTAQKVEVLEVNTELTAVSECVITESKCEKAELETDASETESESTLATVETPETFRTSEASVSDETFGAQSLFKQEEWTVQDRSAVEPHGHQMGYSGELSLPESESALETSEMQRESQKGPDEADAGFLYEKQLMIASLGIMNEVLRGLKQEFEEKQSLSSREMDTHEKELTKTLEECVETSDPNLNPSSMILHMHSDLSDNTVEIRQNLPVEAMDIGSEKERKEEVPQNTTGDDTELLADEKEDICLQEEKVDDEEKSVVDSNGNLKVERSRPGLKRGFEKMARNEESKPTVPKDWAGTSLVLQQVSSLDCTVQKSKIAVKNPHVRPPKDPRTLINKASVEPLAPTRPSQPSPLRKTQGEGLIIPQKGVQGIGFKLPGLGAGFPALRKTDAGRKIRDEGETESTSTESLPVQKSDSPTETKEDSVKPEIPANKPKWTPPRHPGMGNPLMMSELKSKLKKTPKE